MADFDGSTYLTRSLNLDGVVNSQSGTISMWIKPASAAISGAATIFHGFATGLGFTCQLSGVGNGILRILAIADDGSTTALDLRTTTALSADTVYHIAASWDLSSATTHLYVNGSDDANEVTAAAETIAYRIAANPRWRVGAFATAVVTQIFTGSIYDLAFWPGVYLDLSDEDTLHLLVADESATGRLKTSPSGVKPVGYGVEGRNLAKPAAILMGGAFQRNFGTGGKFVLTGQPGEDEASDGVQAHPNPFRLTPRWQTPGERWHLSEQSGIPYPRNQMGVEHREGLSSFGKLIALEEMDDTTRRERPGMNFSDLVIGTEEEDEEDFFLR